MFKNSIRIINLLGFLVLSVLPALGQARSTSADLTGIVVGSSKSPVSGATITATNLATGINRTAKTDAFGGYRISLLPPGQYEVRVELQGFNRQIKKGIILTVGQIAVINFEISQGLAAEDQVIETDTPVIETQRTHQAQTITQRPINKLPIDGRNFLDFTKLTPGVVEESPAVTNVQIPALTTSGLSFAGQNGRANSVQIDGVDNNDISSNGVRPTISQEAVSEFQINRTGYNAEFGRATGGVINIVSKSGSNEFHGSLYNYFRNERLDARNSFASQARRDPPFKRNQPGFTFGGPLKKDKTFFFTAYEGLFRRESAYTTIYLDRTIMMPTAGQMALINALLNSGNAAIVGRGLILQDLLTSSSSSSNPPAPQMLPLNRKTFNMFDRAQGTFPVEQSSGTGSVRVDHAFSEQDYLFFRYSLTNDSRHNIGIGGQFAPSSGFDIGSRDNTFILGETHLFKNGSSNEFRFQSVRNIYNADTVDPFGPRFRVAGIGNFGRDFFSPSDRTQRRLQFVDNFSMTRGNHNFKFGGDYSRYTIDTSSEIFLGGNVDFTQQPIPLGFVLGDLGPQLITDLTTLGRPDLVSVITDPNQPLTIIQQMNFGLPSVINQGFGSPIAQFTGDILGLYLQDSFKVKSNLTLSLGLRYDYELRPKGSPRDGNNFGPRISFAYDPFKNGRTVIRGGGGVYYQTLFVGASFASSILGGGQITNILVSADPTFSPGDPSSVCGSGVPPSFCFYRELVQRGLLNFPSTGTIPEAAFSQLLGLTRDTSTNRLLTRLDDKAVTPYAIQGNLGIEQAFGRDWSVSLNYMINHGLKLIRSRQINVVPNPAVLDALGRPSLTGRVNPTRLADFVLETAGNSTYHGLAASVNKRFSRNAQLIASYTFSKTIDDATDVVFEQGPQDPTNPGLDRALSSFDLRHRLSVAALFDSPFSGGKGSAWYERVLANFYLSPILNVRSGFPFDIRTGIDINMDTNPNDRPVGVGRNTGLGPGFFTIDMRLGRRFIFDADKQRSAEVIFDAFNIFNRVNFKEVNGNTRGILSLSDMGITDVRLIGLVDKPSSSLCGYTSAYEPRIVQLGLKLNF
jgi:outer membrane receptor protein involved in Fe transport